LKSNFNLQKGNQAETLMWTAWTKGLRLWRWQLGCARRGLLGWLASWAMGARLGRMLARLGWWLAGPQLHAKMGFDGGEEDKEGGGGFLTRKTQFTLPAQEGLGSWPVRDCKDGNGFESRRRLLVLATAQRWHGGPTPWWRWTWRHGARWKHYKKSFNP
jgi:hypothetical protein